MYVVRDFFIGEIMNEIKEKINSIEIFFDALHSVYCNAVKTSFYSSKKYNLQQSKDNIMSSKVLINGIEYHFKFNIKSTGNIIITFGERTVLIISEPIYGILHKDFIYKKKYHNPVYYENQIESTVPSYYSEEELFQDSLVLNNSEIYIKDIFICLKKYFDSTNVKLRLSGFEHLTNIDIKSGLNAEL